MSQPIIQSLGSTSRESATVQQAASTQKRNGSGTSADVVPPGAAGATVSTGRHIMSPSPPTPPAKVLATAGCHGGGDELTRWLRRARLCHEDRVGPPATSSCQRSRTYWQPGL